jgi:hypothetical protein
MTGRLSFAAGALVYVAVMLWSARDAWLERDWNFDTIAYVGVALEPDFPDPTALHDHAYAELQEGVPAPAFKSITADSGYRKTLYERPIAFHTQVTTYTNKPLYTLGVRTLHQLGMNAAVATRALSIVGYLGIALVWLAAIVLGGGGWLHLVAAGLFMLTFPLRELAYLSTPDALACFPCVLGGLLLFRGRRVGALVAFAFTIGVRPDIGILVLLVIGWMILFAPPAQALDRRRGALVVLGTFGLSTIIQRFSHAPGMSTMWYQAFEGHLLDPSQLHVQVSWSAYARGFRTALSGDRLYHPSFMALYALLAALGAAFVRATLPPSRHRQLLTFLGIIWLYVPAHFVLLPNRADRYFVPVYLLGTLALLFATFAPGEPAKAGDVRGGGAGEGVAGGAGARLPQ